MNDSTTRPARAGKTYNAAANTLVALLAAQGVAVGAPTGSDDNQLAMAVSDEAPVQLPGVEVSDQNVNLNLTSMKYTEPLLDVPQTIDVIPPEVYTAQGATSLSDVLRNTPGITFFAGEGGSANRTGGDSFYLRGFDTSNSIFVDGVRDEGAVVHDVYNIDQVEVVKGPSSENGRGGTAGYINLETKMPILGSFEALEYVHGFNSDGSRASDRETIDIDQAVPDSTLPGTAVRLNLMDQQGGIPGRQYAENNRWGFAPSLAFGLGTATRVLVSYAHQTEDNIPDYGVPSTLIDGYAPLAGGVDKYFSPNVDPSNYYGFVSYDYEHVRNDLGTLRLEHDFGASLHLNNQTRYDLTARQVEASSPSASVTLAPAGQVAVSQGIYAIRNTIVENQTNVKADLKTGPVDHTVTTGLELSRETADNPIWAVVPLGVANPSYLVNIYDPVNFPAALLNYDPHLTGAETDVRINDAALYAFDTMKYGKHWELTGGVREEHYDVNELSITPAAPAIAAIPARAGVGGAPPTAVTTAVAAVKASAIDLGAGKTVTSGKVGLVYKPTDAGSIYASFDDSVRPPGTSGSTNTLSTTTTSADNPLLQPETSINYEVGVKWNFLGDKLLASAALFKSVNTNVPAADPTTGLIDQTSDQTVQGIELGLTGHITSKWLIYAGYAHMEAKVSNQISTNAQGLTLPLLPKDSGNVWSTYDLPYHLTVGFGAEYMGQTQRLQATQAPISTTFANQVPAYWVESAMVSYAFNKHLSFRLNVGNLTDKIYVASLNNNGYRLNLGPTRSFLIAGDLRF